MLTTNDSFVFPEYDNREVIRWSRQRSFSLNILLFSLDDNPKEIFDLEECYILIHITSLRRYGNKRVKTQQVPLLLTSCVSQGLRNNLLPNLLLREFDSRLTVSSGKILPCRHMVRDHHRLVSTLMSQLLCIFTLSYVKTNLKKYGIKLRILV